jgi:hypothetical protein
MAGNRTKAEATQRLVALGLHPQFLEEEEAAAVFRMSVGAFRQWQKSDPAAPRPHWFNGCKRYKLTELGGSTAVSAGPNPYDEPAVK